MIDHDIHRVAPGFEERYDRLQQPPGSFPVDRRQDDKTGMQFDGPDQPPEVAGVLGDDNPVLIQAPFEHAMVRLPAAADMQRVDRVVPAGLVQSRAN
jgi:hypothetical protein